MKLYFHLFLLLAWLLPAIAFSQNDLMKMLETEDQQPTKVSATFKGTRLINGHTVETRKAGTMDFIIAHRFGRVNEGAYNFFGLDNATIRLGLDYALTNQLAIGIGRSSFQKTYDGFVKYRILQQSSGKGAPVSLTGLATAAIIGQKWADPNRENLASSRFSYVYQVLIARKFSSDLSLQLMPSIIHRNLVTTNSQSNTTAALGIGGRYKITKRVSINAEYYYHFEENNPVDYKDVIAIGFDIETGGHVFQLHFTNAQSMVERGFIAETTGDFFKGDVHFGFNINRAFQLIEK